jgi:hypothetical protein
MIHTKSVQMANQQAGLVLHTCTAQQQPSGWISVCQHIQRLLMHSMAPCWELSGTGTVQQWSLAHPACGLRTQLPSYARRRSRYEGTIPCMSHVSHHRFARWSTTNRSSCSDLQPTCLSTPSALLQDSFKGDLQTTVLFVSRARAALWVHHYGTQTPGCSVPGLLTRLVAVLRAYQQNISSNIITVYFDILRFAWRWNL